MAYHQRVSRRAEIVVAAILALCPVIAPRAQSNPGSATIAPVRDAPDWRLYKNDRLRFEMQFPATWTTRSAGDMVEFTPPDAEKKLSEVWFGPVQPVREAWFHDFDQFARTYEHDMRVSGSRILSRRPMVIGGYRALRLAYEDPHSASGRPIVVDFLIGVPGSSQGLAYRLFYVGGSDAAQNDDPIYRRMLSSLKIRPR